MDSKQFDDLVQSLTTRGTRRTAVQALTGALVALGVGRLDVASGAAAETARGKGRRKAHGQSHPTGHDAGSGSAAPGGSKKKHHHHHHHHPHPPGGGTCTTDGSSVTQTSQTTFKGQTLQAAQTVQPFDANGGTASNLDVTLGGTSVISIDTKTQGQTVTVTITYGAAFQGIRRARFVNDGTTITGDIDGRAIKPLPADGDPSQLQFADGGAPPDIKVDNDLDKAVQSLMQAAGQAGGQCNPTPPAGAARKQAKAHRSGKTSRRGVHASDHPEHDPGCLALYLTCETGDVICLGGTAAACAFAFIGYGICIAIAVGVCQYTALVCRKGIRVGDTCCPVKCGGNADAANPFSDDPSCCERGETCLDPLNNELGCCPAGTYSCQGKTCCNNGDTCSGDGQCCPPGKHACAGVCCSDGACQGDFCCEGEHGSPCGSECCGPFDNCCNGHCCTGTCCNGSCCQGVCTNGVCCTSGSAPCGNGCCTTTCCNNVCCPAGADCVNGACVQVCNANQFPCKGQCCNTSQYSDCCDWGCGVNACVR